MRKQVMACILIATMLALTMPALYTTLAYQHDIDGEDLSYSESQTLGYWPWYCECNHDVWEGDPEDSIVGLGLQAQYCLSGNPPYPYFNYGEWSWEAQYGSGDVMMTSGLSVDACVNGNDHHYYTDYSTPVWGYPPAFGWYQCYYVYLESSGATGLINSAESSATACFYHESDPPPWGEIWWIEAYTQNPPYDPYGQGWSYVNAH